MLQSRTLDRRDLAVEPSYIKIQCIGVVPRYIHVRVYISTTWCYSSNDSTGLWGLARAGFCQRAQHTAHNIQHAQRHAQGVRHRQALTPLWFMPPHGCWLMSSLLKLYSA